MPLSLSHFTVSIVNINGCIKTTQGATGCGNLEQSGPCSKGSYLLHNLFYLALEQSFHFFLVKNIQLALQIMLMSPPLITDVPSPTPFPAFCCRYHFADCSNFPFLFKLGSGIALQQYIRDAPLYMKQDCPK